MPSVVRVGHADSCRPAEALIPHVPVGLPPVQLVRLCFDFLCAAFFRSACVSEVASDWTRRTSLLVEWFGYRNRRGSLPSSPNSPLMPRSRRLKMLSRRSLCCRFFASWWLYSASLTLLTLLSTPQSVLDAPRAFFAVSQSGPFPWSRVSMRAVCMSAACSLLAPCT